MIWRSPKLLERLRGLSLEGELLCCWPLTHVCQGLIEYAHSNQLRDGHAKALKSHDFRIALICHSAHAEHDQGKNLSKDERREAWDEAHRRTVGVLFMRDIVRVV